MFGRAPRAPMLPLLAGLSLSLSGGALGRGWLWLWWVEHVNIVHVQLEKKK